MSRRHEHADDAQPSLIRRRGPAPRRRHIAQPRRGRRTGWPCAAHAGWRFAACDRATAPETRATANRGCWRR